MTIFHRFRDLFALPKIPAPLQVIAAHGDIAFREDCTYLDDLADLILHELDLNAGHAPDTFEHWVARPLMEMIAIPVEPKGCPDWPDLAAVLLQYWRNEREQQRMVDEIETAA